jgi:hypothetical protein
LYKIGDTGPAGGLIFYDKGNSTGGWRYLEAAPEDVGPAMGIKEIADSDFRERGVGWGKRNTAAIMKLAVTVGGGFGWAAQACDAYELNGFDDWFLPSQDELNYMYGNLHRKGLGDFRNNWYYSSTSPGGGGYGLRNINFSDGQQSHRDERQLRVRPIRQF